MTRQAEILKQVRRLVEAIAPAPVCSGCAAERLVNAAECEVQMSLSELAAEREFARENETCGLCGEQRAVIRKRK